MPRGVPRASDVSVAGENSVRRKSDHVIHDDIQWANQPAIRSSSPRRVAPLSGPEGPPRPPDAPVLESAVIDTTQPRILRVVANPNRVPNLHPTQPPRRPCAFAATTHAAFHDKGVRHPSPTAPRSTNGLHDRRAGCPAAAQATPHPGLPCADQQDDAKNQQQRQHVTRRTPEARRHCPAPLNRWTARSHSGLDARRPDRPQPSQSTRR